MPLSADQHLGADVSPTLIADFVAFVIFQGIRASIAKKPNFFAIFQGWRSGHPVPPPPPLDPCMYWMLLMKWPCGYSNILMAVKINCYNRRKSNKIPMKNFIFCTFRADVHLSMLICSYDY